MELRQLMCATFPLKIFFLVDDTLKGRICTTKLSFRGQYTKESTESGPQSFRRCNHRICAVYTWLRNIQRSTVSLNTTTLQPTGRWKIANQIPAGRKVKQHCVSITYGNQKSNLSDQQYPLFASLWHHIWAVCSMQIICQTRFSTVITVTFQISIMWQSPCYKTAGFTLNPSLACLCDIC